MEGHVFIRNSTKSKVTGTGTVSVSGARGWGRHQLQRKPGNTWVRGTVECRGWCGGHTTIYNYQNVSGCASQHCGDDVIQV